MVRIRGGVRDQEVEMGRIRGGEHTRTHYTLKIQMHRIYIEFISPHYTM